MSDTLNGLQKWYKSHCDGEWEHGYGVRIETLDNPGWHVKINLNGTGLEGKTFEQVRDRTSEHDWFDCRIEDEQWLGFGDPDKLDVLLTRFLTWAKRE